MRNVVSTDKLISIQRAFEEVSEAIKLHSTAPGQLLPGASIGLSNSTVDTIWEVLNDAAQSSKSPSLSRSVTKAQSILGKPVLHDSSSSGSDPFNFGPNS